MSFDPVPYNLFQGVSTWLQVMGLGLLLVVVTTLAGSLGYGLKGPVLWFWGVIGAIKDVSEISARRIWALAMLTAREAIRRKALLVFGVFALLFMFGSWFLSSPGEKADIQIQRHVVFVFTAISWLVLPVVLMLSCWGIPEDIKARSMHTVVTKPVRRIEIVLGRMLGFSLIATLVVALMAVAGYIWIDRQVSQDAHGQLVCKVPVYGKLAFLDRQGQPASAGINVGDVWTFRSYIEGSTKACAIWEFERLGDSSLMALPATKDRETTRGLRVQTGFESFRTHKGLMSSGLLCQLTLVNPSTNLRVPLPAFEVAEYRGDANVTPIPASLTYYDSEARKNKTVDLLKDVIADGRLKIEARCLNGEQFLGMARPDMFIRTADRSFAVGFFKAITGVWLQALVIVMIGVAASCFLKGPVATLMTFAVLIVGQSFRGLIDKIVSGDQLGGGPLESIYRMVTHLNQTVELDLSKSVTGTIKWTDWISQQGIWLVQQTFPNFGYFGMSPYVAKGFDVDFRAAIVPSVAVALAYFIPCVLLGYFALKLRELESK
ncbi:MAG TPA: hypothetical protein VGP76_13390 [Planctomycetaceae bacterium]|jgi:hypothetical protein|nr:hypothetical protein [Planctomycetaceae bacterium]